jgi:hypothetical protein
VCGWRTTLQVEEVPKKARDVILATHYVARKEVLHADSPVRDAITQPLVGRVT